MFGLGDQTFEKYNWCSKTYYKYFRIFQMQEFYPFEMGSDHEGSIE